MALWRGTAPKWAETVAPLMSPPFSAAEILTVAYGQASAERLVDGLEQVVAAGRLADEPERVLVAERLADALEQVVVAGRLVDGPEQVLVAGTRVEKLVRVVAAVFWVA